jgi:hypothetical protein
MYPTVVEWNTEHVTYCGGVEIQNMSLTVVEWKYRTCLLLLWSGNTEHVSYCGGIEIQNMPPTVVEWKYGTSLLLWWSGNTEHVSYCGGIEMFCISTPPQ